MRLDPFRIQLVTISLDSQIVLTIIGLAAAGIVFRPATRQEGADLGAGHWWDLVFAAMVGGRLVWIVTHAEYYLRQPLQAVVILDGGLHAIGLALGAAYWVWRHSRSDGEPSWRVTADLVAVGVLTTLLLERVGCALTTCGAGPVTAMPWAILRGDAWYAPLALGQVVILAAALIASGERLRIRGAACMIAVAALFLVDVTAILAGRPAAQSLVALTMISLMYARSARYGPVSVGAPFHGESDPP